MAGKIAWVLILISLAGCAMPKPFVMDKGKAVAVADGFFQAVMRGDLESAYQQYMSPDLKYNPKTAWPQFSADLQAIMEKYGPIKQVTFASHQVAPGQRVIHLYYQVLHAKEGSVVYHLVEQADRSGIYTIFIVDIGNAIKYSPPTRPTAKVPGR